MGRCNTAAGSAQKLPEKSIAQLSPAILHAKPLFTGQGRDVSTAAVKGNSPLFTETARSLLVMAGGGAQAMVDMRGHNRDAIFFPVRKKEMGKRRGIRSPGITDNNGTSGGKHRIPGDYPSDLLFNFRNGHGPLLREHDAQPPVR